MMAVIIQIGWLAAAGFSTFAGVALTIDGINNKDEAKALHGLLLAVFMFGLAFWLGR